MSFCRVRLQLARNVKMRLLDAYLARNQQFQPLIIQILQPQQINLLPVICVEMDFIYCLEMFSMGTFRIIPSVFQIALKHTPLMLIMRQQELVHGAENIANLVILNMGAKNVMEWNSKKDGLMANNSRMLVLNVEILSIKSCQDLLNLFQIKLMGSSLSVVISNFIHNQIGENIQPDMKNDTNLKFIHGIAPNAMMNTFSSILITRHMIALSMINFMKVSLDANLVLLPKSQNMLAVVMDMLLINLLALQLVMLDNMGSKATECKSCKKGYYLQLTNRKLQVGSCVLKTNSFLQQSIYVGTAIDFQQQSIDNTQGTYNAPFSSLVDAIEKAYELGAPYTSAEITILLRLGIYSLSPHAMVRYYPVDHYMPWNLDQFSQTTKIIIRPDLPGVTAKILYKLRDTFRFLVGGGLTIQNLRFDAIDSTIDMTRDFDSGNLCSQDFAVNCCGVSSDGTEECYGAFGTNFFEFDITERTMRTQPSTLVLENVVFENYVYEYNSFIELNKFGGHVIMKNVTFDNMNSCGAIIRNKRSFVTSSLPMTTFSEVYRARSSSYQYDLQQAKYTFSNGFNPFSSNCSNTNYFTLNNCFSTKIEDSTFSNFGKMKNLSTYPTTVDPNHKLQYQGLILDLKTFNGPIILLNNTFTNNIIKYGSCMMAEYIKTYQANPTDKYPTLGTKTKFQMKSWINIEWQRDWPIDIIKNNFTNNTSVQGIIYIELHARSKNSRLIIARNSFTRNAGYIDVSTINIRSRATAEQNLSTHIPKNNNMYCSGHLIDSNYFTQNYGCANKAGGVVKFQCYDYYQAEIDAIGTLQNIDHYSTIQNQFYAIDFNSFSPLISTSVTYYGIEYIFDILWVIFRSNVFIKNFATNNNAILHIFGTPRVKMDNSTFIGNGDAFREVTDSLGKYIIASSEITIESTGSQMYNNNINEQAIGPIYIQRLGQLVFTNNKFESNWLFEQQYNSKKASILYLQTMNGQLTIDGLEVYNYSSVYDNQYGPSSFGISEPSYSGREQAFIHPLIRFESSHFKFIDCFKTSTTFRNVRFQQVQNDENQYLLINMITLGLVSTNVFYNHITSFAINNFYFKDVDCFNCQKTVISFSQLSMTITNMTLININSNTQKNLRYQQSAFMEIVVRKPYLDSNSALRTEKLTIDGLNVQNFLSSDTSKIFYIYQDTISTAQTPAVDQIIFKNSNIQGYYSPKFGAFLMDSDSQYIRFENTSFRNISVAYNQVQGQEYSAIRINNARKLVLEAVSASDIYNKATQLTSGLLDGCGRLVCVVSTQNFDLVVSKNTLIGTTDGTLINRESTILGQLTSNQFTQPAMIEVRLTSNNFNGQIVDSQFINCTTAYQGSTINIVTTGSKTIDYQSSVFKNNAALYGGAIYCSKCSLTFTNLTFDSNTAIDGGDIYIEQNAIQTISFNSLVAKNSYSTNNGGSIIINDVRELSYIVNIKQTTGINSTFTNIYSGGEGGVLNFASPSNLDLAIEGSYFDTIKTIKSGGAVMISKITANNQNLNINVIDSKFRVIEAQDNDGGVFHLSALSKTSTISIQNSDLNQIKAGGIGGAIYSANNDGGIAYFSSTTGNKNFTLMATTIISSSADSGKGGLVFSLGQDLTANFLEQTNIKDSYANQGSLIYSENSKTVMGIKEAIINGTKSTGQCSGILLNNQNSVDISITQNSQIYNLTSALSGGLMYINAASISLNVLNSNISSVSSQLKGGVIYISSMANMMTFNIDNSQFTGMSSFQEGSVAYINGTATSDIQFTLQNSLFNIRSIAMYQNWPTNYNTMLSNIDNEVDRVGGLFYFDNSVGGRVIANNNIYRDCYNTLTGSTFYVPQRVLLQDNSSLYKGNGGYKGVISLNGTLVQLNNVTFIDSVSKYGSIIHIINNGSIEFTLPTMLYGKARFQGGAFYAEGKGPVIINIVDCVGLISYFESNKDGGFLYTDNIDLSLNFTNCTMNNIFAKQNGGFIYIKSLNYANFTLANFQNISSNGIGTLIYSDQPGPKIRIHNSTFQCSANYNSAQINADVYNNRTTLGSLFYVKNADLFESVGNTFQNCYTQSQGAIFNLDSTIFTDQSSIYKNNAALQGGACMLTNMTAHINNATFTQLIAWSGGAFYFNGPNKLYMQDLTVDYVESFGDGGFMSIIDPENTMLIEIKGKVSITNVASRLQNAGAFYINAPKATLSLLESVIVQNSSSKFYGGFMQIKDAQEINIVKSLFLKVKTYRLGSFIYSESSIANININQSTFDLQGKSTIASDRIYLTQRTFVYACAFYLKNLPMLIAKNNTYKNCYAIDYGSVYRLENATIIDDGSFFLGNAAVYGGNMHCKSCNATFKKSVFENTQANQGGLLFIQDKANVYFENLQANSCYSIQGGGFLYAKQSISGQAASVKLTNFANLTDILSENSGGSFYIDHPLFDIDINEPISIVNTKALSGSGGVFNIVRARNITIQNSVFRDYSSTTFGSFLYSQSQVAVIYLINNSISGQTERFTEFSEFISSYTIGGSIYVSNAQNKIISARNVFENTFIANQGSIFTLINSVLDDTGSTYQYNKARFGGVIYCDQCNLNLKSSIFENNQAYQGGVFYIKDHKGIMNLDNITITHSQATYQGGAFYLIGYSTESLIFRGMKINDSSSKDEGGVFYLDHTGRNILMDGLNIQNCYSLNSGGIIFVQTQISLNITNSQFHNFTSYLQGSMLYSDYEQLELIMANNTITCVKDPYDFSKDLEGRIDLIIPTSTRSGTFYLRYAKIIEANNNTIQNCYLADKGAAFYLFQTQMKDVNSTYRYNSAIQGSVFFLDETSLEIDGDKINNSFASAGGVIYVNQFSPLSVSNSVFVYNQALKYGGVAHISQPVNPTIQTTMKFSHTSISGSHSGMQGGVFYIDSNELSLIDMNAIDINNSTTTQSGGVFSINALDGELRFRSDDPNKKSIMSVFAAENYGSCIYSVATNLKLNISQTIVQGKLTYNRDSVRSRLSAQTSNFAGAIYISGSTKGIFSNYNEYRNCYIGSIGGVYTLISITMIEIGSTYFQNAAVGGGAIKCDSCILKISKASFSSNQAYSGGAILLDNQAQVNISQTSMTYNYAEQKGGVINIIKSGLGAISNLWLEISDCIETQFNYANQGGFLSTENQYVTINIYKTNIYTVTAVEYGGMINIVDAARINIVNSRLSDSVAPVGATIFSTSTVVEIYLYSNYVECQPNFDPLELGTYLDLVEPKYQLQSNFMIRNAKLLLSEANEYYKCGITNFGGVFTLQQTNFNDTKSYYHLNAGAQGGIINCQESNASFVGTVFDKNYGNVGGVISINQNSYLYIHSCSFTNNYAYASAGVIYVSTESYFTTINTIYTKNYAPETATIQVLGSSPIANNTILNCNFEYNTADKNTISLMYSNTYISKSSFENNKATIRSKNIFMGFSNVQIYDTKFSNAYETRKDKYSAISDSAMGTYFFIIFDVNLIVQSCQFQNGIANLGGAIYISGDSDIRIYNCKFQDNYAASYGGAIYAVGFNNLIIAERTSFKQNLAPEAGDDIYVSNTDSNLTIENVDMTNPNAKNSIYAEQVSLHMYKTTMNKVQNENSNQGAGIYCLNCRKINISYSTFKSLSSEYGGAIYIEENEVNKKTIDKYGKYMISESVFQSNQGLVTGGAIYLNNPQYFTLNNTQFISNSVYYSKSAAQQLISGAGGAIYYTCDEQLLNCKFDLINKNKFTKNTAEIKGGAIYWDVIEPIFKSSNVQMDSNYANKYGDDISCFSQNLKVINWNTYLKQMVKAGLKSNDDEESLARRLLIEEINQRKLTDGVLKENSTTVNSLRSGGVIPRIYLAHVDKYGQIVGSDSSSKVRVTVNQSANTLEKANEYPPVIEGDTQFIAVSGMIIARDLIFTATPGYKFSISFSTDGIDMTKQSNIQYLKQIGSNSKSLDTDIVIEVRGCSLGEQFTTAGKCVQCPEGETYSLEIMTKPGDCATCPLDKAVCNGGQNIGPKQGYWRRSNSSSTFIRCLYEAACLGMVEPENNPMGSCAEGYQKILCADCIVGFSRKNEYECGKCPDQTSNIVRIVFVFLAMIVVVVFVVRSTLQGAKETGNITGIFFKILLNHIQLIMLTASFNFNWPAQVMAFFDTSKPVAAVSTQILSFDCFLDLRTSNAQFTGNKAPFYDMRIFFQKLVMLGILPFVCALATIIFWRVFKIIKKTEIGIRSRLISTMVIVLFLIHPSIVQYMFLDFKCMDIEDESRVVSDLEVICWSAQHRILSFFVAIPSIIVWGLGIPAFALLMMYQVSNNLSSIDSKERYGFLFRGYKEEFYFWEILNMYRKMTLIFIAVFVKNIGVIAQALIVFVILIVQVYSMFKKCSYRFLIVNLKKKPYITIELNNLELLSLVTSMITVYCGLFFIADKPADWIKENPEYSQGSIALSDSSMLVLFIIIVIANLIFLVYWLFCMFNEIRLKIRNKFPKIYLVLCLCFNTGKFASELLKLQQKTKDDEIKQAFLKRIKELKRMYNQGKLILNENTLEKLQVHLDPKRLRAIAQGKKEYIDPMNKKRQVRVQIDLQQQKQFYSKVHDLQKVGLNQPIETQNHEDSMEKEKKRIREDKKKTPKKNKASKAVSNNNYTSIRDGLSSAKTMASREKQDNISINIDNGFLDDTMEKMQRKNKKSQLFDRFKTKNKKSKAVLEHQSTGHSMLYLNKNNDDFDSQIMTNRNKLSTNGDLLVDDDDVTGNDYDTEMEYQEIEDYAHYEEQVEQLKRLNEKARYMGYTDSIIDVKKVDEKLKEQEKKEKIKIQGLEPERLLEALPGLSDSIHRELEVHEISEDNPQESEKSVHVTQVLEDDSNNISEELAQLSNVRKSANEISSFGQADNNLVAHRSMMPDGIRQSELVQKQVRSAQGAKRQKIRQITKKEAVKKILEEEHQRILHEKISQAQVKRPKLKRKQTLVVFDEEANLETIEHLKKINEEEELKREEEKQKNQIEEPYDQIMTENLETNRPLTQKHETKSKVSKPSRGVSRNTEKKVEVSEMKDSLDFDDMEYYIGGQDSFKSFKQSSISQSVKRFLQKSILGTKDKKQQ
ncbi:UNKNOWN [Stylonychia lemnae]|uniref:Uncharacterized protein n=1 Tax=Stylonychia lemnae TaxID=5949 RepID=A0A077ZPI1_STYLE|nr:UNKNOWN [Stylonychia lemnae]|eukprot:CDW71354.1 UNKNOWN [Stylonychia lemnae]